MNTRDKIDAAVAYLKSRNVSASNAAPPVCRLCWRAGWHVPPPHFLGFFTLGLLTGLPFGIGLTAAFVPFFVLLGKPLAWSMGAAGIAGALLFGSAMATYYRWSARRLGVPPWADFGAEHDAPDETW